MTKLIHWLLPAVCGSWLQALAAGPQRLPLESCLPPDARDLAPSEQLLNFTEAFVQLDQFQTAKGQLVHDAPSRDDQIMLRFVAAGSVASEESGFSEDTGFLSTIVADTGFLNFEAWSNSSALCNSLAQGCPYQAGDVALGLHIPLDSSYAFSSITTKVTILDTSDPSRRLACFRLTATPYYPEYAPYKVILWAPVALTLAYLLVTWIARIWTAYTASMLNREAELAASLTSRLSANGIRERWAPVIWDAASGINLQSSQALRRFATPHARDILWSIQFFAMLAWIAVDWPDFFYPVAGQVAWSTLAYNISYTQDESALHDSLRSTALPSSFPSNITDPSLPIGLDPDLPEVLLTIDGAQGIERFASVIGLNPRDLWPNAAAIFATLILACIVFSLLALLIAFGLHQGGASPRGVQATKRVSSHGALDEMAEANHPHGYVLAAKEEESGANTPASAPAHTAVDGVHWQRHLRMFCGNILRLTLLFQLPLVVLSTYHITLLNPSTDTFAATHVSVAFAILLLLFVVLFPFAAFWRVNVNTKMRTASDIATLLSYGPLYNSFGHRSYQFMLVRLSGVTIVGIVVGALQSTPLVQIVVMLVFEIVETLTTALWLPYGETAAMGPLTFCFSVIRVITAVLLLIITPAVNVGRPTIGWIVIVIMALHAVIFLVLFFMLLVKIVELIVRAIGHAPFDESKSRRATGLGGALRRWDRRGRGLARRRATLDRKTRDKFNQRGRPSQQSIDHRRHSQGYASLAAPRPYSPGPQFFYPEGDDGYIMSAMSGPRFDGINGYVPPGSYAAPPGSARSWHGDLDSVAMPYDSPQQGTFTVVRGRRSSPMPYGPHPQHQTDSHSADNYGRHRKSWSTNDYFSYSQTTAQHDAPNTLPRPRSYHAEIEFASAGIPSPLPHSPSPQTSRITPSISRVSPAPDLLSNLLSAQQADGGPKSSDSKSRPLLGFIPRLGNRKQTSDDWSDDSDDEDSTPIQRNHGLAGTFASLGKTLGRRKQDAKKSDVEEEAAKSDDQPVQKSFQVVRRPLPQQRTSPQPQAGPSSSPSPSQDATPHSSNGSSAPESPRESRPALVEEQQMSTETRGISASLTKPPENL